MSDSQPDRRLGGWIHVGSDVARLPDEILPFLIADHIDFRSLVCVREPIGPDLAQNRAWETRLTVDRLLLENTRDDQRSLSISVGDDVAPQRVNEALERAVFGTLPFSQLVLLSEVDLSSRLVDAPSPILTELRQANVTRQRTDLLRAELISLAPPERRTMMRQFVCDALAGVLGLSEEQRSALDVESQLDAVGLDSLMTMEFFMGMGRDLQLEIAADWFESGPSLADIAAVLVERLEEAANARATS